MNQNQPLVTVRKLTDQNLLREACEMTFIGKSNLPLLSMYKAEHSPARTQLFWIECKNIPLFVSTHLLRHHVGSIPFQLTCREDRKGGYAGLIERIDGVKSDLEWLNTPFLSNEQREYKVKKIMDELSDIQETTDRKTPVNLGLLVNAQSLIDMAKLRECKQAHAETRKVFKLIKEQLRECDSDLAEMMVKKCIYRNGLCGETRCCGYNTTPAFEKELTVYLSHFTQKQKGIPCK